MATEGTMHRVGAGFTRVESDLHGKLVQWGIPALRIAVGLVFLGFGLLKFFPDVSPAQDLAETTFDKLSFGLVPGGVAIIAIATLECFIGISFLLNRWIRVASWLLVFQLVGILSPLVLLPGRLFDGPGGAPTLEGQYVIKDIVLVGAAMVIAAGSFRQGRMIREEPSNLVHGATDAADFSSARKLEIVIGGAAPGVNVAEYCLFHGVSQSDFYRWRDAALAGGAEALERSEAHDDGGGRAGD